MVFITVNITPTVELNALAMKRGEPAVYTFLDTVRPQGQQIASGANAFNYRGMFNQRYLLSSLLLISGAGCILSNCFLGTISRKIVLNKPVLLLCSEFASLLVTLRSRVKDQLLKLPNMRQPQMHYKSCERHHCRRR